MRNTTPDDDPRSQRRRGLLAAGIWCSLMCVCVSFSPLLVAEELPARQITHGPFHHFFGYIGHVRTIPWNASERYLLTLRSRFQDRMPAGDEAADIMLLDTQQDYAEIAVDRTRAWNFQQGTMLYWNPLAAETQFFFNDRDPQTARLFTVLYDLSLQTAAHSPSDGANGKPTQTVALGGRKREYRFGDTSIANSGVAPAGKNFAAINYGRLARLRPVTGYPEAADWTVSQAHPVDDGVFVVDIETGQKDLIVNFRQLGNLLRPHRPDIDEIELFINHTLWSPGGEWLFFFCRGEFEHKTRRVDVPFVVRPDGSELTMLPDHFGGHPEWLDDQRMIGRQGQLQALYNVEQRQFTGALGTAETFVNPGGDVALSLDGRWFVNGYSKSHRNHFVFYRMSDGLTLPGASVSRAKWHDGPLRIDPAPCWNRSATAILTTAVANDEDKTRQLFLIEVPDAQKEPNPAYASVEDIAGLPRVLLIGDSISIGYTVPVRESLKGKANVHRPKTNCGPTTTGLRALDYWLGDSEWDVIHFNWGLHDLKYMGPQGQNLADPNAPTSHQQVPPDVYEKNLEQLVERLEKTGAKLIWRNTTPVPEGANGRVAGDSAKYNAIAEKVMQRHGIEIHDLHEFVQQRQAGIMLPANVHFTKPGYEVLAQEVAAVIMQAVETRKSKE